jgi:hypothetical protein
MNSPDTQGSLLSNGHFTRFLIARALASELSPQEMQSLELHAQSCPTCGKAWQQALGESSQFTRVHPSLHSLRETIRIRNIGVTSKRKAAWTTSGRAFPVQLWERWVRVFSGPKVVWAMATVAMALGAVVYHLGSQQGSTQSSGSESDWTPKGLVDKNQGQLSDASYYAFVNGRSATGDSLRVVAGDTLQFGIVSAMPVYYALYYRDDGGDLKPYFPAGDASLSPIGSATGENLPKSLVLDSLWKREMLYALASPKPFTHDEALARIQAEEVGQIPQQGPTLKRFLLVSGKP